MKETWKRVKERERKEQEQLRQEGERRVKMLLQYKENLHKTQHKLKKNSVRKRKTEREREVQRMAATAEDRYLFVSWVNRKSWKNLRNACDSAV